MSQQAVVIYIELPPCRVRTGALIDDTPKRQRARSTSRAASSSTPDRVRRFGGGALKAMYFAVHTGVAPADVDGSLVAAAPLIALTPAARTGAGSVASSPARSSSAASLRLEAAACGGVPGGPDFCVNLTHQRHVWRRAAMCDGSRSTTVPTGQLPPASVSLQFSEDSGRSNAVIRTAFASGARALRDHRVHDRRGL